MVTGTYQLPLLTKGAPFGQLKAAGISIGGPALLQLYPSAEELSGSQLLTPQHLASEVLGSPPISPLLLGKDGSLQAEHSACDPAAAAGASADDVTWCSRLTLTTARFASASYSLCSKV